MQKKLKNNTDKKNIAVSLYCNYVALLYVVIQFLKSHNMNMNFEFYTM